MRSRYDKEEIRFRAKKRKIEKEGLRLQRIQELKSLRESYKSTKRRITTTKLIVAYLFVIMNIILAYSMFVMYEFHDLTYLGVLITDIAAQVLVFLIYSAKSYKENKSQADLEFEREKFNAVDTSVG